MHRRYELGQRLGAGGFGSVYRAELVAEGGFRKHVALKLLHEDLENTEHVARLRDEARVLGLLRHRGMVGVDGLVRAGDRWAVVMERVDGQALDALLAVHGRLPVGAALAIGRQVAEALQAAYDTTIDGRPLRLVHRDVKPSNIQLTPDGVAKLLDFGVARADFGAREVNDAKVFGSPPYMSPERLIGDEGPEGDVYALALTLGQLVTGLVPEVAELGPEANARRIAPHLGAVSPQIAGLLKEMLAFRPDHRPPAGEVARRLGVLAEAVPFDLEAWARRDVQVWNGEPGPLTGTVLVEDATPLGRRGRWRRLAVASLFPLIGLATAGLLVVTVSLVLVGWLALRGLAFTDFIACTGAQAHAEEVLVGVERSAEVEERLQIWLQDFTLQCSEREVGAVRGNLVFMELEDRIEDGTLDAVELQELERFLHRP